MVVVTMGDANNHGFYIYLVFYIYTLVQLEVTCQYGNVFP